MMESVVTVICASGVIWMLYRIQEKIGTLTEKVDTVVITKDDHEARIRSLEQKGVCRDSSSG